MLEMIDHSFSCERRCELWNTCLMLVFSDSFDVECVITGKHVIHVCIHS